MLDACNAKVRYEFHLPVFHLHLENEIKEVYGAKIYCSSEINYNIFIMQTEP